MSCSTLQSGFWGKCSNSYSRGSWDTPWALETPILFFQSNRFLFAGSLHATCVIFQVMTPKWGKSTFPSLLWDENPNTWLYLGIRPMGLTCGKIACKCGKNTLKFSLWCCSSSSSFISHHKPLWLGSHSLGKCLWRREGCCALMNNGKLLSCLGQQGGRVTNPMNRYNWHYWC